MRLLWFLLLLLPSVATAQERAQQLLQRLSDAFGALGAYEVRFEVALSGPQAAGRFAVEGERYYIELADTEVFGSADVRYEVDHRRREVVAAPVERTSQNLLSDPVHAFDFVASQYEATLLDEEEGRIRLRLQPRAAHDAAIQLTLDAATALPTEVRYEAGEEAVTISIGSVNRLGSGVKTFDRKAFEGYEWIDFR